MKMLKNKFFGSILIILILVAVFFWKVLVNPNKTIYPAADIINYYSSWNILYHNTFVKLNQFPFWNPYETSGAPFIGNFNSAMFYPIDFLFLIFNPDNVFGYIFFIDVLLAGIFMFLLMRYLKLDKMSSLLSSIAYMFSGIFIGRITIGHYLITNTILWIPIIFLFFIKTLDKKNYYYAIVTGILLGLQILGGHLQFAIYTVYALIGYFIFNLVIKHSDIKTSLKSIPSVLLIFLIAFLVSSMQLLPSLQLSNLSPHGGSQISYSFLTSNLNSYSMTPRYLITFLMPDFFGNRLDGTYWVSEQFEENIAYIGILPLLLSFLAVFFVRNKYTLFFTILGTVSLFFSFGQYNPAFPYIHGIILFFDILRDPARFLFLFVFSFTILSGFGFNFLQKMIYKRDKKIVNLNKIFAVLSLLVLISTALVYINKSSILSFGESKLSQTLDASISTSSGRIGNYVLDYYFNNKSLIVEKIYNYIIGDFVKLFLILFSVSIILFARLRYRIGVRYVSMLLIFIIIIDLWMFGSKYIDVAPIGQVYSPNAVVSYLANQSDKENFRVLGFNRTLEPRFATRNGIDIIDGFIPQSLNYYIDYYAEIGDVKVNGTNPLPVISNIVNLKLLDLLNVKYVLSTEKLNQNYTLMSVTNVTNFDIRKLLYFNETVYLYRNDNMLPRVFVVNNYIVMTNKSQIFSGIESSQFDPRSLIILEKYPSVSNSTQGMWYVNITSYSSNKITLQVKMSQPGFLVMSEIWYPAWRAFYSACNNGVCSNNKNEVPIYKTDYVLRSIYLDKGEYNVEFVYDNNLIDTIKSLL